MTEKLLVVDDDQQILTQIRWVLAEDYTVFTAGDRDSAIEIFRREQMSVVLLDHGLPPEPRDAEVGLQLLEDLISQNPLVKVIIVSGTCERANALRAVDRGAHDIFPKPVDLDELQVVIGRVFKRVALEQESLEERQLAQRVAIEEIIGASPAMLAVFTTVRKVAGTDIPVLIHGESGTGKELVANAIHNLSARSAEPFVPINCAAIPETLIETELFGHERGSFTGAVTQRRGKIEYARGGTLFLDEIAEVAPELQVKILRFLQEKVIDRVGGREPIHVDARIIAATNRDLEGLVKTGRFRADLFLRLAVVRVPLPPLRERGSDVIELAEHLLSAYCREFKKPPAKFSGAALEAIRRHPWPGNVRELQNRVKRGLVLTEGRVIGPKELELEDPLAEKVPLLKEAQQNVEKELVERTLQQNGGNISKTARILGISRPTLYSLLSRHGLR